MASGPSEDSNGKLKQTAVRLAGTSGQNLISGSVPALCGSASEPELISTHFDQSPFFEKESSDGCDSALPTAHDLSETASNHCSYAELLKPQTATSQVVKHQQEDGGLSDLQIDVNSSVQKSQLFLPPAQIEKLSIQEVARLCAYINRKFENEAMRLARLQCAATTANMRRLSRLSIYVRNKTG